jgi:ABC-type xylose transport system substrate-binding protein
MKGGDEDPDRDELVNALELAHDQGIRIIGWGDGLVEFDYDLRVSISNAYSIGAFQAEILLERLGLSDQNLGEQNLSEQNLNNDSLSDQSLSQREPQRVEILANSQPNTWSDDYVRGVCSILQVHYQMGNLQSENSDCSDEQPVIAEGIDETDALNFGNSVKKALESYLPTTFSSATFTLAGILCGSDSIAKEVSNAYANASLLPWNSTVYPTIIGVGAMKIAVQNMLDLKQDTTVIYNNHELAKQVALATLPLLNNALTEKAVHARLIAVTLANMKRELIDSGYLTAGEAGL